MVKEKTKKILKLNVVILCFGFSTGILLFACSISSIGNNTHSIIPLEILGTLLFLSVIAPALEKGINGIINIIIGNLIGFGLTILLLIEGGKITAEILLIAEIYLQIFSIAIISITICFLTIEWLTRKIGEITTNPS